MSFNSVFAKTDYYWEHHWLEALCEQKMRERKIPSFKAGVTSAPPIGVGYRYVEHLKN